jgi:hypothetical protein
MRFPSDGNLTVSPSHCLIVNFLRFAPNERLVPASMDRLQVFTISASTTLNPSPAAWTMTGLRSISAI